MKVVAPEEHSAFPYVAGAWRTADAREQGRSLASFAQGATGERLLDFGDARLAAMDAAGIDVQVLSLTTPGVQGLAADLDHLDMLSRPAKLSRKVPQYLQYLQDHLYVTPSGLFSERYLRWSLEILGPEYILVATDYPYQQASRESVTGSA